VIVKNLKINNLRNISSADIEPGPQVNILYGANGAGKTSVIESLVVLAKGRSFRSGNAAALVGPAGPSFRIFAKTRYADGTTCRLGLERSADAWRARIDGADAGQLSDLAPRLPLVLLEPNSHLLISGPPEVRRKFIDWGVFHVEPVHLDVWRRFNRAVKQRNAALKSRQRRSVASLDPQVVSLGGVLERDRRRHVVALSEAVGPLLEGLSPDLPAVSLTYEPGWRGDDLGEVLRQNLERDLERGSTGSGPHRADLAIRLDGAAARERLSRGEQKILAAALVLTQATIMTAAGNRPLMLMDDLSSEFDRVHLANVLKAAKALGSQAWITGTASGPYLEAGAQDVSMFHVKQGKILAG